MEAIAATFGWRGSPTPRARFGRVGRDPPSAGLMGQRREAGGFRGEILGLWIAGDYGITAAPPVGRRARWVRAVGVASCKFARLRIRTKPTAGLPLRNGGAAVRAALRRRPTGLDRTATGPGRMDRRSQTRLPYSGASGPMSSPSRSTPQAPVGKVAVDGAEELIERHYSLVYNLAYRTMGRREDAEDIAQQTFARALPRLAELRDPNAIGGWLCRIAANLCMDELRRRPQTQAHVEADLDGLPDSDPNAAPATVAERRAVRAAVWSAALSLPHQQRLALALREWQELSYKQIGEALNMSVPAVEAILFRARQAFRRAYQAGTEPWPANETCKWMVERLSASIDEELRAGERARIDAHLPWCATCQFAARELRAAKRLYGPKSPGFAGRRVRVVRLASVE
jgi:RNA polymerase sigma-70 factor (ECF subfamily)